MLNFHRIRWATIPTITMGLLLATSGCGGGGSNNQSVAVSTGLIHWWKFNGDATDSIGTLNAAPIGPVSYAASPTGQGIVFNGSTTGISLPVTTDMQFQNSFSISAWAKLNAYVDPSEIWSTIIFCGDDRGGLDPFFLQVDSNGTLQFESCSATRALGINATMQFPLNQWVHITGTYNRSTGTECLYINGKIDSANYQVPDLTPVVPLDPTQNPGIGIGTNNNFPNDFYNMGWNGEISDLRIYNRALNSAEVKAIYNLGFPPPKAK